jgi:phosphoribosylpyrophosphate synthetase
MDRLGQMDLVGRVEGCDCILVDDMIDTAGTLCAAAEELRAMGALRVFAYATHGYAARVSVLAWLGANRQSCASAYPGVIVRSVFSTAQRSIASRRR